ncbi:MAG: S24 family peptidase [Dehalococcoidales bacterium]|nr:S24 family peptidase [Dehalococcoidales bacterium]
MLAMIKKNDKPKDRQRQEGITEQIKGLLASLDMKPLRLSQKTGIDNAIIYKCLGGKRNWNLDHLELIAPVLGVTLSYFFKEPVMVPHAGEIKDGQGPLQSQILRGHDHEGQPLGIREDTTTLSKMYCLSVTDRSMVPTFPPDTRLVAQRETSDSLKNENFVVYWAEDGLTYIRQLFFDHGQIVLRSLTQGVPDKILPVKHIALCDKILRVEFPA